MSADIVGDHYIVAPRRAAISSLLMIRGFKIEKDQVRLSGQQIVAARTLLGLTHSELAAAACISVPTLKRMEGLHSADFDPAENDGAVRSALQVAGVEFMIEHDRISGVRLRAAQEVDGARPSGRASDAVDRMDAAIKAHRLDEEMRRTVDVCA